MRKHFLLLFLMAILPLAGWAADYTGVVVTLTSPSATYNGANQLPGVTVQYDNAGVLADVPGAAYTATWNDGTADVDEAVNAKTYTLTIAATDGNTLTPAATGGLVKTFTIAKKLATVTINAAALTANAYHRVYGWKPADFAGTVITTAKAALTDGEDFSDFVSTADKTAALNNIVINWGPEEDDVYYAAGEHTFTLSFNSMSNYIVSLSPSTGKWYVDKKDLIISADATTTLTYGDVFDETTASTHVTYNGFVDGEDEKNLVGDLGFTSTYDAAVPAKSGVGDYSWSPSGQTSDNYNITYNNGIIRVVKKNIATEGVSIAEFDAVPYNGGNQKPTAIKSGTFKNKTLTADDYDLVWYEHATIVEDVITAVSDEIAGDIKNADTYYAMITGKGNYDGTVYKAFTINKVNLGIRTANLTKVYDATNYYGTATAVTYSGDNITVVLDGLKGEDTYATALSANPTLSLEKNGTPITDGKAIDAGEYNIKLDLTGVTSTNYTLQAFSVGKLTISKRVVKITANDKSKKFGTTDPYKTGVLATAADVTVATTPATEGILGGHAIFAYPMLQREGDEAKGSYNLNLVEDADHKLVIKKEETDVTANYAPQFIPGTFTIGEGEIGIWADTQTVTYGITVAEAKDMLTATIIGMTTDEINDVQDDVNAKVVLNVPAGLADTDKLPANETGYSISFADFEAADVIPAEILANYSSTINKYSASAKFIVNKKPLEIQVLNQSLLVGDEVKAASAQTVKILTTGLSAEEQNQVIDNIELVFSAASPEVPVAADKLTAGAATAGWTSEGVAATEAADFGIWYDGIVIDPTTYNGLDANYSISNDDVVAGILYVNGASAALALDRNNPTEIMEKLTSGDNKTYVHVTFANNRTLSAGKWNMMVLPFEVSVPQLSATLKANTPGAIGYAIVNVLNSATTSENIRFELTMGTIPANTPFLVKPASDVDLNTVSFDNVMIVAPAADEVVNSDYTFGGVEFVGLYTNKADLSATERTVKANQWVTDWTGANLKPFEAYLRGCGAKARVFVQDLENGTTAIKELNVETMTATAVDGWYTLNGIRLQGAPTEKGVYINNGKKVVLK